VCSKLTGTLYVTNIRKFYYDMKLIFRLTPYVFRSSFIGFSIDMTRTPSSQRYNFAIDVINEAGKIALSYFSNLSQLKVEKKGHQDLVSEADKNVEIFIRKQISNQFPDDEIIGEEGGATHIKKNNSTGYVWVIDPIDGTANFVSGIPAWTVVIALVKDSAVYAGFILDPVQNELFTATTGEGAFCNGQKISVSGATSLHDGSVAVGFSNRSKDGFINLLIEQIVADGGVFFRNASGALSLAYVATGRLIGYSEDHMNAWDYLAGQLIVKEAGGMVEEQNISDVLENGGRVIASVPAIFSQLESFTEKALK
jgi:myo-inositol-1(or 4)-monophosphatase